MIAQLTGILAASIAEQVVIDVQGVGYEVTISEQTRHALPARGQSVQLCIHTHVREDQLCLFGFATREERALFRRLLSVSGIGPRLAMAILSGFAPAELVHAVADEDTAQLATIPGIGKKTAQRIVVDLRDRLLKDHAHLLQLHAPHALRAPSNREALSALLNLGYAQVEAERALRVATQTGDTTLGPLLKRALQELAAR